MINLRNTRQPLKDMFRHNLCHLQFNENNQNSANFNTISFLFPSSEPTKESETKFPFPVVIGAACGGAFVLCLVTYFVIRQCKREGEGKPGVP